MPTLPSLQHVAEMPIYLVAEPNSLDEPWLHFVFLLFIPKLRKLRSLSVEPLPWSSKESWRTLHPFLPRSIPAPRVPIDKLTLDGQHFSTGRILSRLLSSIPLLKRLVTTNAVFGAVPTLDDFRTLSARSLSGIETDNLDLCQSLIPPLVANTSVGRSPAGDHGRRSPRRTLIEDDLMALRDVVGVFNSASTFTVTTEGSSESKYVIVHPAFIAAS